MAQLLRNIEEGLYRKQGKQSSLLFGGKMTAHLDCVADELIKAGRASDTETNGSIQNGKNINERV